MKQQVIDFLMGKQPQMAEVNPSFGYGSDVDNFISLNIDAFDKELENSVLLKTRYRLGFRKDIYVDMNSWLWRNYYKEMYDIYY